MSADEDQPSMMRELLRGVLRELAARGGEDDHRRVFELRPKGGLDGSDDQRCGHNHSCTAAVRRVVSGAVAVSRPVAQIMNSRSNQVSISRPSKNALLERTVEHPRKQGEDIDLEWIGTGIHRGVARSARIW